MEEPCIIIGEPCEELLAKQKEGFCVLAELKSLQGLDEEATAEALSKSEAVLQYKNVCIDSKKLPQAYFRRIWSRHIGQPVLIWETDRLLIRESIEEDGEAFLKLYREEECCKFLEKPTVEEESVESYRKYIKEYQAGQYAFYEYGMWSVIEKTSGKVVGRAGVEQFCLEAEEEALNLGYAILSEFRGKGYAAEAGKAILQYCAECEYASRVYVRIHRDNEASKRVYEKIKDYNGIAVEMAEIERLCQ